VDETGRLHVYWCRSPGALSFTNRWHNEQLISHLIRTSQLELRTNQQSIMVVGRVSLAMVVVALLVVACRAGPFSWLPSRSDPVEVQIKRLHNQLKNPKLTSDTVRSTLEDLKVFLRSMEDSNAVKLKEKGFLDLSTIRKLLDIPHVDIWDCEKPFANIKPPENAFDASKYRGLKSYLDRCEERRDKYCRKYLETKESLLQELNRAREVLYAIQPEEFEEVELKDVEVAVENALQKLKEAEGRRVSVPPEQQSLVKDLQEIERICTEKPSLLLLQAAGTLLNKSNPRSNLSIYLHKCHWEVLTDVAEQIARREEFLRRISPRLRYDGKKRRVKLAAAHTKRKLRLVDRQTKPKRI
jgi:hypothetical protein